MNCKGTLRIIGLLLLVHATGVYAQTGTGSSTVDNSTVYISAGTTELRYSEGTYFGPKASWVIDGTLEIWSKNIWIAPGATFSGAGQIIIHNPGANPFYPQMAAGPTTIDGNNGAFINLLIEHQNNDGMVLADIRDPGYGTANPSGALAAELNIGGTIDLGVDNANIVLNGNNLAFDPNGKIINYGAARMVSTGNSIAGHVIKTYADSAAFVFPVGIAEGDYTPATITPKKPGTLYVSVEDYSASFTKGFNPALGMDRTWNIYASVPLSSTMTLQHNPITDGSEYQDANAVIQQYNGNDKWTYLYTINPATGTHTTSNADIVDDPMANGVWFTKFSLSSLFIPNLFTPNGDNINDTFTIRGLDQFAENDLIIVNRWGGEVYHQANYKNSWTGEGLNEGTYFYVLKVKRDAGAEWQVYKGYVTLIRDFKQ